MLTIPAKISLYQVRDGAEYTGTLDFAGTELQYTLALDINIRDIDNAQIPDTPEGLRNVFHLTLRRGEATIDLTEAEYAFFLLMLLDIAVEFYNHPQTRDVNEGPLPKLLQNLSPDSPMKIGIKSSGNMQVTPEMAAFLQVPKFGCAFTT